MMDSNQAAKQHSLMGSEAASERTLYVYVHVDLGFRLLGFGYSLELVSCNFFNAFLGWFRYPYVTGSSVVALKYKDGILMAADMGG
jgi:hypothetical protein